MLNTFEGRGPGQIFVLGRGSQTEMLEYHCNIGTPFRVRDRHRGAAGLLQPIALGNNLGCVTK